MTVSPVICSNTPRVSVMMSEQLCEVYDVVIVGAGPAGATFAKELAKSGLGLKILLIDGQSEKNPKPCGGLLAPDAQKVLAEFDLTLPRSVLADPQIFAVETIDLSKKCVQYYQRHYLNMDRFAFDRWLLSLAAESVTVTAARCVDIRESDGIYTLYLECGGKKQAITAKAVVGADGGGSIVRRKLMGRMPKQYVSIQEWYRCSPEASAKAKVPYYSCIFDPVTSDSCSWTIHKDGYVIFGGAFEKRGCQNAFEKQKKRLEAFVGTSFGEAVKREACLVTSPRRFRDFNCGKERVYLLGEAAGFISSSSFEGISSAILSGRLLAEAFAAGGDHKKILKQYKKKTLRLRFKLFSKTFKRWALCTPFVRHAIMKSGIQTIAPKS